MPIVFYHFDPIDISHIIRSVFRQGGQTPVARINILFRDCNALGDNTRDQHNQYDLNSTTGKKAPGGH